MKIGIVAPGGFDRSGTVRVVPALLWLVERLARRHEVHVYTLYQGPHRDDYRLAGATIHNVGGPEGPASAIRAALLAAGMATSEHRRTPFHALHGIFAGESGLAAAAAGRRIGVPSVVTVAGGELVALPDIGYGGQLRARSRWVVAAALRMAGAVTTGSEYMLARVRRRRADARVVVLGADRNQFVPPDDRERPCSYRLLHVASLNRVKDQPTLLRAFRRILDAEPLAGLAIVGEDTMAGAARRLARDLGLDGAVTFHGFQPTAAVAHMLQRSDALMHSARSECGQVVVLEAALAGVPTIGTAVGLVADLSPGAATAVPVDCPTALADAALSTLRNGDGLAALRAAARQYALAHDADSTAAAFEEVYRSRRSQ